MFERLWVFGRRVRGAGEGAFLGVVVDLGLRNFGFIAVFFRLVFREGLYDFYY